MLLSQWKLVSSNTLKEEDDEGRDWKMKTVSRWNLLLPWSLVVVSLPFESRRDRKHEVSSKNDSLRHHSKEMWKKLFQPFLVVLLASMSIMRSWNQQGPATASLHCYCANQTVAFVYNYPSIMVGKRQLNWRRKLQQLPSKPQYQYEFCERYHDLVASSPHFQHKGVIRIE